MLLSELPTDILKRVKEIVGEQKVGLHPGETVGGSFSWGDTIEGPGIWNDVENGDYKSFYDFYPKVCSDEELFKFLNS